MFSHVLVTVSPGHFQRISKKFSWFVTILNRNARVAKDLSNRHDSFLRLLTVRLFYHRVTAIIAHRMLCFIEQNITLVSLLMVVCPSTSLRMLEARLLERLTPMQRGNYLLFAIRASDVRASRTNKY